ncbi:MAG: polymer-forming cytoskeletal protein [Mariprofundaceae bacterium]
MKRKSSTVDNNNIETIIGQHASFTGELEFEGAVRIDGRFDGNIRSQNGGTLIVSEVAKITGEVEVPNLVLHGTIRGNVRARESLKITATGKLIGDVEYHVISLSEGASINGRCNRMDEKQRTAAETTAKPRLETNPELIQAA